MESSTKKKQDLHDCSQKVMGSRCSLWETRKASGALNPAVVLPLLTSLHLYSLAFTLVPYLSASMTFLA